MWRRRLALYAHKPYRPEAGYLNINKAMLYITTLVLCGSFYLLSQYLPSTSHQSLTVIEIQSKAEHLMRESIGYIARARGHSEYPLDIQVDPNATGLIGIAWSEVTTTLGDVQAKRTATHPRWARVVVHWMHEAGVQQGDTVWATFSGSFPGLNVAVLAAAEALGVHLYAISSLGASTWGANIPDFVWSDMERVLYENGLISRRSIAVSFGGTNDQGPAVSLGNGDPTRAVRKAAERSGLMILPSDDLTSAVTERIAIFEKETGTKRPALYVNVGGGHASGGDCADAHRWPIGLTMQSRKCQGRIPGMLYVLSERNVPVLHLLNVKELALMTGIPIDGRF